MPNLPFVITISRQLGSGGAYLGQRLAERMGVLYMDREILCQAAKQLKMIEDDLESRDERKTSVWEKVLQMCALSSPDMYVPPEIKIVNDQEFYQVESDIIRRIADEHSAVIIGRGGFYVLRQHLRHLSIFLHADFAFRQQRIRKLYNISEPEAKKLIEKNDRERARYVQALTGQNWNDARQYHLAINTSNIDLDKVADLVLSYIERRFGDFAA